MRTVQGALFGEEPEKQRPAVPQNRGPRRMVFVRWGDEDAGETPSACLSQEGRPCFRSKENEREETIRTNINLRGTASASSLTEGNECIPEADHRRTAIV
jgi:hypothetical protein